MLSRIVKHGFWWAMILCWLPVAGMAQAIPNGAAIDGGAHKIMTENACQWLGGCVKLNERAAYCMNFNDERERDDGRNRKQDCWGASAACAVDPDGDGLYSRADFVSCGEAGVSRLAGG